MVNPQLDTEYNIYVYYLAALPNQYQISTYITNYILRRFAESIRSPAHLTFTLRKRVRQKSTTFLLFLYDVKPYPLTCGLH